MKKLLPVFFVIFSVILFSGQIKAQENKATQKQDSEKYYKSTEVDKTIAVKSKPRSSTDKSCIENSGRVSLRVYFNKSGKIDKAEIAKPSSCDYFNKSSLEAAKRIIFEPAIKNGKSVSYTAIVEYNWNKY